MRLVPRARWRDQPDQDEPGSVPISESKSGQDLCEVPVSTRAWLMSWLEIVFFVLMPSSWKGIQTQAPGSWTWAQVLLWLLFHEQCSSLCESSHSGVSAPVDRDRVGFPKGAACRGLTNFLQCVPRDPISFHYTQFNPSPSSSRLQGTLGPLFLVASAIYTGSSVILKLSLWKIRDQHSSGH